MDPAALLLLGRDTCTLREEKRLLTFSTGLLLYWVWLLRTPASNGRTEYVKGKREKRGAKKNEERDF